MRDVEDFIAFLEKADQPDDAWWLDGWIDEQFAKWTVERTRGED